MLFPNKKLLSPNKPVTNNRLIKLITKHYLITK